MSARFAIAVAADLGGTRAADWPRLHRVTLANLSSLPERLGVSVDVPDGDGTTRLVIRSSDDFQADALLARVPGLSSSRATPAEPSPPPSAPARESVVPPPTGGASLLDAILGGPTAPSPVEPALTELVRRVSEPFVVRATPSGGTEATVEALRRVLRTPRFHELEATWCGLANLIASADGTGAIDVWVLDASPADAPAALAEALASPDVPDVSVLLGAYRYGPGDTSLAALAGIATVAQAASIPVVVDVEPRVVGVGDARALAQSDVSGRIGMGDHWRRFRSHALAAHVVACLPRVLGRLPYGRDGERVASLPFDEGVAEHEQFLWTSAALAFGCVVVSALAADGSTDRIERHAELGGLPVHVARDVSGEAQALPCAEVAMHASTIQGLVDQGCTVLASIRDTDRASFYGIGMIDGSPLPSIG